MGNSRGRCHRDYATNRRDGTLAALVHSGDIVLSLAGKKVDAAGIDQFAKIGIAEVTEFKHVDRPRDLPLGPLQDLCDLLDVPKGLIVNPANRDDGVAKIQRRAGELLGKVVAAQARIPELIFLGQTHSLRSGAKRLERPARQSEGVP